LNIQVHTQQVQGPSNFIHHASQDVVGDFWDGYAFGQAMGIGIQSTTKWWIATDVNLKIADPVTLALALL